MSEEGWFLAAKAVPKIQIIILVDFRFLFPNLQVDLQIGNFAVAW